MVHTKKVKTPSQIGIIKMKFKTAYTKRDRQQVSFENSPSLTKSEQAQACDTNHILERFVRTGVIDHVQTHEPQYGDFENFDFHAMQNKVAAATQMFEELPAKVRASEFNNDPAQFIEFIAHQANVRDMDDGIIGNSEDAVELASTSTSESTSDSASEKPPE